MQGVGVQHEPCWFVRKKNAAWYGKAGENSTIWDSPSPKFIMGGADEDKYDHPTQKPVAEKNQDGDCCWPERLSKG